MGYDYDRFVSRPSDEFKCSICFMVFENPVSCLQDHYFCRECLSKWLRNHQSCPLDRARLTVREIKTPPRFLTAVHGDLMIRCEMGKAVDLPNIEPVNAEAVASIRAVVCPVSEPVQAGTQPVASVTGCVQVVKLSALKNHQDMDCRLNRKRFIKCPQGCKAQVIAACLDSHSCVAHLQQSVIRPLQRNLESERIAVANLKVKHAREMSDLEDLNRQLLQSFDDRDQTARKVGQPMSLSLSSSSSPSLLIPLSASKSDTETTCNLCKYRLNEIQRLQAKIVQYKKKEIAVSQTESLRSAARTGNSHKTSTWVPKRPEKRKPSPTETATCRREDFGTSTFLASGRRIKMTHDLQSHQASRSFPANNRNTVNRVLNFQDPLHTITLPSTDSTKDCRKDSRKDATKQSTKDLNSSKDYGTDFSKESSDSSSDDSGSEFFSSLIQEQIVHLPGSPLNNNSGNTNAP